MRFYTGQHEYYCSVDLNHAGPRSRAAPQRYGEVRALDSGGPDSSAISQIHNQRVLVDLDPLGARVGLRNRRIHPMPP